MILMLFGFGMMIFGATANLYYGYCVAGAIIFSLYIIFGALLFGGEGRAGIWRWKGRGGKDGDVK